MNNLSYFLDNCPDYIKSNFFLYVHMELSKRMYHTSINNKANVGYSLKFRVLFFLWKFIHEHDLNTVHKDILVEAAGSNIRSVNRIIKELIAENIIDYNKGFVIVKDTDKLIDILCSSDNNSLSNFYKNSGGKP